MFFVNPGCFIKQGSREKNCYVERKKIKNKLFSSRKFRHLQKIQTLAQDKGGGADIICEQPLIKFKLWQKAFCKGKDRHADDSWALRLRDFIGPEIQVSENASNTFKLKLQFEEHANKNTFAKKN